MSTSQYILVIVTSLVGLAEIGFGLYFWKTNSRNAIRRIMALLAFSTGAWVLLSALTTYAPESSLANLGVELVYVFGAILVTSLLIFVVLYPYPIIQFDRFHLILLFLPVLFFSYAILFGSAVIVQTFVVPTEHVGIVPGPLHGLYNTYIFILFVIALAVLFLRAKKLDRMYHRHARILFWSILIGGLPAVIIDLVFTSYFGIFLSPLIGTLSSVIWLGAVTWIVFKPL
jgi:hypothetical protein